MTARAPIRVERKGWRKAFHPTGQELEDAVRYCEAEAGHWRWEGFPSLMDWIGSTVRAQILVDVAVEIVATHIETDDAKIAVWTRLLPPAYCRIGQSQVGATPETGMEAGFIAVASAVERMAKEVKGAAKQSTAAPANASPQAPRAKEPASSVAARRS